MMKYFNYTIDGKTIRIKLDPKRKTIAEITSDGQPIGPSEAEMPFYAAAISLALLEYDVEIVHDEETDIITLSDDSSAWGNPIGIIPLNAEPTPVCVDTIPTGEII